MASMLEADCLQQLSQYVKSLGGDLGCGWKCRAQVRDYGSRAGSIDMWFTSPEGEVFRSKIAAARGLGLDPSRGNTIHKPRAPRKPSNPQGDGAAPAPAGGGKSKGTGANKSGGNKISGGGSKTQEASGTGAEELFKRWAAAGQQLRTVDLSIQELGELLMSMPAATDTDDCYEGLLFYKEAHLRHAARLAARGAAIAPQEEAVRAAFQPTDIPQPRENTPNAAKTDPEDERSLQAEGQEGSRADELHAEKGNLAVADGLNPHIIETGEPLKKDQGEETDEAEERGGKASRRNTRHSMAAAVAAAAAALAMGDTPSKLDPAVAAAAADAAGFLPEEGGAQAADVAGLVPGPPNCNGLETEVELIRKCFVKVPVRLGRPLEDEPAPLSPTSRSTQLADALLSLSDSEPGSKDNDVLAGTENIEMMDVSEINRSRPCAVWAEKKFPLDQLTANGGEPTSLHPAALFYLRHLEEELEAEERAARREAEERAARREAKRLEKAAAQATGGGDGAATGDAPRRLPVPRAGNLSLRGKTVEEIEAALMERLSSYVADLGGKLPAGWKVKASVRQNGANAGGVDAYYFDPRGRRLKSMIKVAEALGLEGVAGTKPRTLSAVLGRGRKKKGADSSDDGEEPQGRDAPHSLDTPDENDFGRRRGEKNNSSGKKRASKSRRVAEPPPPLEVVDVDASKCEELGSARKTCGTCRTCLNPQLKKGCLVNRAKRKDSEDRPKSVARSPSPSQPLRKLTARQAAKREREQKSRRVDNDEATEEPAAQENTEVISAQDVGSGAVKQVEELELPGEDFEVELDDETLGEEPGEPSDALPTETRSEEDSILDIVGAEDGHDYMGEEAVAPSAAPPKNNDGKGSSKAGVNSGGTSSRADSKRSRGEAATGTAIGNNDRGGSDDNDDEDDGGGRKRLRRDEEGHAASEGARRSSRVHPKPKEINPPSQPAEEDQAAAKAKKEAEKAARREKRKARDTGVMRNVYDRAYNRLKGQLSRLRQEQALVEAYAADGWRGASREKVKPVAEIKRAKEQIQRCKEIIRECVKVCDEAEGDQPIPAELFDSDGELELDHLFCAKCRGTECTDDNDIIMCDGHCDRAYHVKCLIPPVDPTALPEDEGWLCPACDHKIDMIDDINDEFGTEYEYDAPWQQILAPGTLPSSPHGAELGHNGSPRAAPVDLGRLEGFLAGADLPSEDEEDEDYEASASESDKGKEKESAEEEGMDHEGDSEGESLESLESEDLGAEILDVELSGPEAAEIAKRYAMPESSDEDGAEQLIVEGKRRRKAVDYHALNKEMFGDLPSPDDVMGVKGEKDEEEDEVWSPKLQARKRRQQKGRKDEEEEGGGDEKQGEGVEEED